MMPGPIGATSGKFVLMGAALLLHGRIDDNDARIAIMPGAPTSAISSEIADRRKDHGGDAGVRIHLRAESFRSRIDSVEARPAALADIRIGQDILDGNPIEIDFVHHDVQPLSISEARRLERKSKPVVVRREADGTRSVELAQEGHAPLRARLDLAQAIGVAAPNLHAGHVVQIGGVDLIDTDAVDDSKPVVGLYAFRHVRVIFDLGHDRIWVRR